MSPENCENPSLPGDPLPSRTSLLCRGQSKPSPGGHLPTPSARRVRRAAPLLSPGEPRAAVWVGRGAVAGGPVALGKAGAPRGVLKPNTLKRFDALSRLRTRFN